jgi:hypothetical protein
MKVLHLSVRHSGKGFLLLGEKQNAPSSSAEGGQTDSRLLTGC